MNKHLEYSLRIEIEKQEKFEKQTLKLAAIVSVLVVIALYVINYI